MASLPVSFSSATIVPLRQFPPRKTCTHVSCLHNEEPPPNLLKFDRRNLLLGMGGLYVSPAVATPISGPDLAKCTRGQDLNQGNKPLDFNCCPPVSPDESIDYKLPPVNALRFHPAAHQVTPQYIAKYEKAMALMKALPKEDPRSFYQQANVHCAYCNLTYQQTGCPQQKLQIHFCWHFFPWHRWYIYFYERILSQLIDDPTFGLPFWNWDNCPPAPLIPQMYLNENSPLYTALRDPDHLPPSLADLKYTKSAPTPPEKILSSNLTEMYGEMIRNSKTLEDFYGAKYVVGTPPKPGMGTVERGSHTAVHLWVGKNTKEGYDMGNFSTAGRDPLFYAHHANVDRLWSLWRDMRCRKPKDFWDSDWLDANYLFYDENKRLVRVYVKDCLDHEKMGYAFQKVDNPWMRARPKPRHAKTKRKKEEEASPVVFPVKLDRVVVVVVDRIRGRRSNEEKEEVLVIEEIEADTAKAVRFEVYVNDIDDKPGELIDKAEYAGCFAQVPLNKSTRVKSRIRLGLSELLEDLEIEDDDKILVSLVPKAGGEDITIGGIKIINVDI